MSNDYGILRRKCVYRFSVYMHKGSQFPLIFLIFFLNQPYLFCSSLYKKHNNSQTEQ